MDDYENWSDQKKQRHRILKRAFANNNGAMVISCLLNMAAQKQAAQADAPHLQKFLQHNEAQPRPIRALNLLEEKSGSDRRFHDASNGAHAYVPIN